MVIDGGRTYRQLLPQTDRREPPLYCHWRWFCGCQDDQLNPQLLHATDLVMDCMAGTEPNTTFRALTFDKKVKSKPLLSLLLASLVSLHAYAQSSESIPTFEEMRQEALEYNKTVTDQEMVEFFELIFKYHPRNIAEFRSQSPDERKAFLAEHRRAADEAGVKISTLRGLDEDQLRQMDEIAKWDAEQALVAEDALNRLQAYSAAEYRTIVDEAVKLIRSYDRGASDELERQTLFEGFPSGLAFIRPELIHIGEDWCIIYLQKGIGRGIGYRIDQGDSGEWAIAWFNEYDEWGSTRIDLESLDERAPK